MTQFEHDKIKPFSKEGSKKEQVSEMFDGIAERYDFMNRILSAGIDIGWRKKAILMFAKDQPQIILDVATGTGDMAIMAAKLIRPQKIVGIDISEKMLEIGRKKVEKEQLGTKIELLRGDGETINFPDNSFDGGMIAFGVRNFENLEKGLSEMVRVLKPGGTLFLTMVNRYALDGFYLNYHARKLLGRKRVSGDAPHCEFTTPAEIEKEVLAAGFSTAVHRGVLLGPMRILYKLSTRIARRIAPVLEPFDDAICSIHLTRAFAGHLVTVATR